MTPPTCPDLRVRGCRNFLTYKASGGEGSGQGHPNPDPPIPPLSLGAADGLSSGAVLVRIRSQAWTQKAPPHGPGLGPDRCEPHVDGEGPLSTLTFTHVPVSRGTNSPLWLDAGLGNSVFANHAPAALAPEAQWCEQGKETARGGDREGRGNLWEWVPWGGTGGYWEHRCQASGWGGQADGAVPAPRPRSWIDSCQPSWLPSPFPQAPSSGAARGQAWTSAPRRCPVGSGLAPSVWGGLRLLWPRHLGWPAQPLSP